MKVLVVDSGGRGHVIAWQFKNDPHMKKDMPFQALKRRKKKKLYITESTSWLFVRNTSSCYHKKRSCALFETGDV